MAEANSSVLETFGDFLGPTVDVFMVEDEIVEENVSWDLRDMMSKDNCGPSSLRYVQDYRRTHGLSVPSDARFVQKLIEETLVALVSADGDEASLSNLKEAYAAEKAELEKSLAASKVITADVWRRIQEYEHNTRTMGELATKVETNLRNFEKYVRFLRDEVVK